MGRAIIRIAPDVFTELFLPGIKSDFGQRMSVTVESGLPGDAKFITAWFEPDRLPEGHICLLYESDYWSGAGMIDYTPWVYRETRTEAEDPLVEYSKHNLNSTVCIDDNS